MPPFNRLSDDRQDYDITFPETENNVPNGKEVYAHRVVLANSSPYFQTRLESGHWQVDAMPCRIAIFRVLIKYIYTRNFSCRFISRSGFKLRMDVYYAAVTIQLPGCRGWRCGLRTAWPTYTTCSSCSICASSKATAGSSLPISYNSSTVTGIRRARGHGSMSINPKPLMSPVKTRVTNQLTAIKSLSKTT